MYVASVPVPAPPPAPRPATTSSATAAASLGPDRAEPGRRVGQEWAVDAAGLDPGRLAGEGGRVALADLFADLVATLDLHPIAAPIWHVFPGPHEGVTGIVALSESHLACHSFPESGGLTLNLYTCRARPCPDWAGLVARHVGYADTPPIVDVRVFDRSLPAGQVGSRA